MLSMFSDEQLKLAETGDLPTLIELDKDGFCLGTGESASEYAERLKCLQSNIAELGNKLEETGFYILDGIRFTKEEIIERERFLEVADITESEYAFKIDWVPGFYQNPSNSWLFGGCAFYFYPDFFVVFMLRKSFAATQKWLIYDRRELLAHELCHIARIGIEDDDFEEHFAYRLSFSAFRRLVGGMFHSAADSLLLLGVTFSLLFAQLVKFFLLPPLWLWPFWLAVPAVVGYLAGRHVRNCRRLARAGRNLCKQGVDKPQHILFRMTAGEIKELARDGGKEDSVDEWLAKKREQELRWQVIDARFINPVVAGEADSEIDKEA